MALVTVASSMRKENQIHTPSTKTIPKKMNQKCLVDIFAQRLQHFQSDGISIAISIITTTEKALKTPPSLNTEACDLNARGRESVNVQCGIVFGRVVYSGPCFCFNGPDSLNVNAQRRYEHNSQMFNFQCICICD